MTNFNLILVITQAHKHKKTSHAFSRRMLFDSFFFGIIWCGCGFLNSRLYFFRIGFKCACSPGWQPHFRSYVDRAYNTLHFASKVVCQRDTLWKPFFVGVCSHTSSKMQNQRHRSARSRCWSISLICLHGLLTVSPISTVLFYHFRMICHNWTLLCSLSRVPLLELPQFPEESGEHRAAGLS